MKKIKLIFKNTTGYIICSLLVILFSPSIWAKKVQQHELSRDWMYKKSNVYITAHPAFSPSPKITSLFNPFNHNVKLSGVMNFNFGFVYMYNFNKSYGISIGLYNALMSFKSFTFLIKMDGIYLRALANSTTGYEGGSIDRTNMIVNHATNFPLRFVYRNYVSKKIDLNIQAGIDIQLHRSFLYQYESNTIPDNDTSLLINTSKLSLENNGNKNFSVIPYFGFSVGINQLLKNNHYINYQFSGHIPFLNPYTNGKFSILPDTPYEAHGTFKLNPMSFGLEVNYVFTFNRRKLHKERHEEEIHYFKSKSDVIK